MRRPWRIEFRYRRYSTSLNVAGAYEDWTPWDRRAGAFATAEAAERMASGDFGYYLSFSAAHEIRIVNVDAA